MDKGIKINIIPNWMNITMTVCKWFVCIVPFIITSVMWFSISELTTWDNWLLTCIYSLSVANIINMTDKK